MYRRRFVAVAGGALATVTAGCIDGTGGDDDVTADDTGGDDDTTDGTGSDDGEPTDDSDPGNGTGVIREDPRVDEPPYEIRQPEPPEDGPPDGDWNDLYLCENMPDEPSLPFEVVDGVRFAEPLLSLDAPDPSVRVNLLTSDEDFDALGVERPLPDSLAAVDFDSQAVVVVSSGFGSGSVSQVWKRIEDTERGIYLHGCYTAPFISTDDYTWWSSVLLVDRPETLEFARASLTTAPDRRIHVNSTEGVVSPPDT